MRHSEIECILSLTIPPHHFVYDIGCTDQIDGILNGGDELIFWQQSS